ncbi:MAG: hypothetical protein NTZ50_03800 [Chloroflexi bacterium]|nr:hypothetical protein [Chloroflexota bacterium]
MWFLVIQILALIAAAVRGWKFWPFLIWGCLLVFGAVMGPGGLRTGATLMLDIVATGVFLLMAIVGRKSNPSTTEETPTLLPSDLANRVQCPHCAEMILPDAKVCRFCGRSVHEQGSTPM